MVVSKYKCDSGLVALAVHAWRMFLCACEGAHHIWTYVGWGWGKEEGLLNILRCV
jgi:hypothetical protein